MKKLILDALSSERLLGLTAPLTRAHGIIFFAHRFADVERGSPGHDPEVLRQDLELLRRNKFNLTTLVDVVQRLEEGVPLLPRTIVFTIDDGYADYYRVAAPIFAEFDCPATVFVTTGFLDGQVWMWWDQIAFILENSKRSTISLELDDLLLAEQWRTAEERELAAARISRRLYDVSDEQKWRAISALADCLEVEVPVLPPENYSPMSWEDVRKCERLGTSFGPHTITHPILSRLKDSQAELEVSGSWERLKSEVKTPVPVFCFPDGSEGTYSERDVSNIRRAGLLAAVTTCPRYINVAAYKASAGQQRFRMPRFSYPEPGNEASFSHIVSGIKRGRALVPRQKLQDC